MATNLTAAKTLIRGVRRQPRELKEELLKMLPKVGQGHTCTYCGYVTAIPSSYQGMWVVCDSCGGV